MSVTIVSREGWQALPPKKTEPLNLPAKHISFKFTETDPCTTKEECIQVVQDLQKNAMKKGMPDIPFNFLVGGDRRVYEGRGWTTKVYDEKMIVGYLGKENGEEEYTEDIIALGYELMQYAVWHKYLIELVKLPEDYIPGV